MITSFVLLEYKGKDCADFFAGKMYPMVILRLGAMGRFTKGYLFIVKKLNNEGERHYKNESDFFKDWQIAPEGKYSVNIEQVKNK